MVVLCSSLLYFFNLLGGRDLAEFRGAATLKCTFFLQAVTNINTLLDKADRVYHQLMGHRPQLESLLSKVNEAAPEKPQVSLKRGLNSTLEIDTRIMLRNPHLLLTEK